MTSFSQLECIIQSSILVTLLRNLLMIMVPGIYSTSTDDMLTIRCLVLKKFFTHKIRSENTHRRGKDHCIAVSCLTGLYLTKEENVLVFVCTAGY